MSDDLEMAKLRTTSPATGTVEMIRRCRWAHYRISALEAALAKADELADDIEGQATHRISGQPHNPAMPKVFRTLTAYRQARDATR